MTNRRSLYIGVLFAIAACVMTPTSSVRAAERDRSAATIAEDDVVRVRDLGSANLMGAYVESDYLAWHGTHNSDAQRLGRQEAAFGRDAFNEALLYLRRSPRAAELLDRLDRSGERITIVVNHRCENGQRIGDGLNSIVSWDPSCAYRAGSGSDSPSLVLLHELVHTLHVAENPQAFLDYSLQKSDRYDTLEERRTILFAEIPVARELGEAVRTDRHENRPFRVYDPTVR